MSVILSSSQPKLVTDKRYESKRTIKGAFNQRGANYNYKSRPFIQRLYEYERVIRNDNILASGIDMFCKSIISTIDAVTHPDPEIADFLNANLKAISDNSGTCWQRILYDILHTTMWAGFSVSENLFNLDADGKLVLEDVVTYHPASIELRVDKHGRLTENKPAFIGSYGVSSYGPLKSGIFQRGVPHLPEAQLPMWKCIYTARQGSFGNYYGHSAVAPAYRWFKLKEALVDMMTGTLDRYGNPLIYIKMPVTTTSEKEIDASTGLERNRTTYDILKEQIDNLDSNGNIIFLPQTQGDNKPDIGVLATGGNAGGSFLDPIQLCNEQMILPIGVPYFLIYGELKPQNKSEVEQRMATFYSVQDYVRRTLLSSVCKQIFSRLITYNFNRESAKILPDFARVYSNRSEDRVATMQVIQGMVNVAALNPQVQEDLTIMRQMVQVPARELQPVDLDLYNRVFVDQENLAKVGIDAKLGQGANGGRPTGSSSKQIKPRAKTISKPKGVIKK